MTWRSARAPVVVLGPGTGLGEAVLTWEGSAEGGRYRVWPSEGSHADFAPRGALQRDLAAAMEAELGECEVEQVCCGVRLSFRHALLCLTSPHLRSPHIALCSRASCAFTTSCAAIAAAAARTACPPPTSPTEVRPFFSFRRRCSFQIFICVPKCANPPHAALRKACPLCVEAVDVFLEILGAECGNLGLKLLARGGVYIAGGIPGKLLPLLRAGAAAGGGALERGFVRTGCRFEAVRRAMSLHVVLAKDPGLDGARSVALQALAASK